MRSGLYITLTTALTGLHLFRMRGFRASYIFLPIRFGDERLSRKPCLSWLLNARLGIWLSRARASIMPRSASSELGRSACLVEDQLFVWSMSM